MAQTFGIGSGITPAGAQTFDRNALRPFSYGWKRLTRRTGMQQHTERRSVRSSQLSVSTVSNLERPPPTARTQSKRAKRLSTALQRQALAQETLLETKPTQVDAEGGVRKNFTPVVHASFSCQ